MASGENLTNCKRCKALGTVGVGSVRQLLQMYEAAMTPLPEDNDDDFPKTSIPFTKLPGGAGALSANDVDTSSRDPVDELDQAAAIPLPEDELEQTNLFEKLIGLVSIEEFKTVFIDIVTCHHLAYTREGTLYRSLTPNQIMFMRNKKTRQVTGMLVDCDPLLSSEQALQKYRHIDKVSSRFSSDDFLDPITPLYRHDLESIFYVLLWCTVRFRFQDVANKAMNDSRSSSNQLLESRYDDFPRRPYFTAGRYGGARKLFTRMGNGFHVLKEWLSPMLKLLDDQRGSLQPTKGDETILTYETFMAAMGVCLPDPPKIETKISCDVDGNQPAPKNISAQQP